MKNTILLSILLLCFHALQSQCFEDSNYWKKSWVSCQKSENPNPARPISHWLLYEFTENHAIDSSRIWNANRTGESNMGAKEVVVDYSTDGITWLELGTYNFPKAPESDDYIGFEGPHFQNISIKKILITILSTHGNDDNSKDCASIAEVQFKVNSEVCSGELDICGVCDGPGELTWYIDEDGDGLGSDAAVLSSCSQPDGYVANSNDECDDGRLGFMDIANIFNENGCNSCHLSGSTSGFNYSTYENFMMGGNNCGEAITKGIILVKIIRDGGVNCSGGMVSQPMNEYASGFMDEEELDAIQTWIDKGAYEHCSDACAGEVDECGVCDGTGAPTWYADMDGDGLGDPNHTISDCAMPVNFVQNNNDDNDSCNGVMDECGVCMGTALEQTISAKVLLEGAYESNGMMRTDLLDKNLLELQQPFNRSPWQYSGNESVTAFPADVTDWVLVELKCQNAPHQTLERKAAFLRNDGTILNLDGKVGVSFNSVSGNKNYNLIVRTRNHLAVVSNSAVQLPFAALAPFDMTQPTNVLAGENQLSISDDGYYMLVAGDFNSDGVVSVDDFNLFRGQLAHLNKYVDGDINMDGNVTLQDYNLYTPNKSVIGVEMVRY